MRDSPADETFFRIEIENVEFIDPGRDNQQGPFEDAFGRGRILDQLEQIIAINHLAGGCRHILPDFEFAVVGLAQFQTAIARLYILRQHFHAAHEIIAVLLDGFADQFRIGDNKIGRRQGR